MAAAVGISEIGHQCFGLMRSIDDLIKPMISSSRVWMIAHLQHVLFQNYVRCEASKSQTPRYTCQQLVCTDNSNYQDGAPYQLRGVCFILARARQQSQLSNLGCMCMW
jgi:hypothetical protein